MFTLVQFKFMQGQLCDLLDMSLNEIDWIRILKSSDCEI